MKHRLVILLFAILYSNYAISDGCRGAASFNVTYNPTNNCYFFTNTTSNDCGSSGVCTWDFGDGTPPVTTIQGANTVCHTYNCNNTYTVYLIYDASSCVPNKVCTGSQQIIVNQGPNITGLFSGPISACVGDPTFLLNINISVSTGVNLAPYTIYYNIDGVPQAPININSNNASVNFNPAIVGVYNFIIDSILSGTSNICPTSATTNYQINVYDYPSASLSGSTTVCENDNNVFVRFTGSGNITPYTFTYTINNGNPQSITTTGSNTYVDVPVSTNNPGNLLYNLINVSGGSLPSCPNQVFGLSNVLVLPKPLASINYSFTVCENDPPPSVEFTGTNSTPPYQFTYIINGGPSQTITTTSNSNTVLLPLSTQVPGTYTISLLSVTSGSIPACTNSAFGTSIINVIELPNAQISGGGTYCQNSPSPIIDITGSGSIGPYLFTYNINGGSIQTINSTNNVASISVPTNLPGVFLYKLISVESLSSPNCKRILNQIDTVIIRPLPSALISPSIKICQNDPQPIVTFTGIGGIAPYLISYSVDGIVSPSVITNGNTFSVNCSSNQAGVYNYNLISIYDSGNPSCGVNLNLSTQVEVIDLPVASITGSVSICQNSVSPVLTINCSGNNPSYSIAYNLNNGPLNYLNIPINSNTISIPTSDTGIFTYNLIEVTGSSNPVCKNLVNSSAVINVKPTPTATIRSQPTVCINDNPAEVVLNGYNGFDPYTFDYLIDNIPFQAQSVNGSLNLLCNTATVDTVNYILTGVTSSSNPACFTPLNLAASVFIEPTPIIDFVSNPIPCEFSSNIEFINLSSGASSFVWQIGDKFPSKEFSPSYDFLIYGDYQIKLIGTSEFGCVDSLTRNIYVNNKFSAWTPNAFTPNEDLKNEVFYPVLLSAKEATLTIYNRWGDKVFESNSLNEGWDGTYKGSDSPEGIYIYLFSAVDLCNESHNFKGFFSLVR